MRQRVPGEARRFFVHGYRRVSGCYAAVTLSAYPSRLASSLRYISFEKSGEVNWILNGPH